MEAGRQRGREAERQEGTEGGRADGGRDGRRAKVGGQLQYIYSGKINKSGKILNKIIFINVHLLLVFLARFPAPTFHSLELRKIVLVWCMDFCQRLCF